MNDLNRYLVGAYAIGFVLLWGYAFLLWFETRALNKAERARKRENNEPVNL